MTKGGGYSRERRSPPHRSLASSSVVGGDSYSRNTLLDLFCALRRVGRPVDKGYEFYVDGNL
jgi:hypothetical protein